MNNPFIDRDAPLVIPTFKATYDYKIRVSDEANRNLKHLLSKYNLAPNNKGLSKFIECIGLMALKVEIPTTVTDPESNITTDDCRQAGFEDAIEGNPQRFLMLFGRMKSDFEEQYVRGFMEGSYLRNEDK